jgi:S-DNA-T family DNA segregation ATPase FtsK/SpoIIIE
VSTKQVPESMPAGRALIADGAVEVQVALLVEDESGPSQAAALAEIAKAAHVRDGLIAPGRRPFRVDVLPARLTFDDAWKLRVPEDRRLVGLVGVGGDELAAVGPDLGNGPPAFVVAGPGRSGKSTVLAVMAESLVRQGARVVLAAPKPSPLRALTGRRGVLAVVEEATAPLDRWTELLGEVSDAPLVVLIDDADVLRESPAGELFRGIVRGTAGPGRRLVLGGNSESICTGLSGWQVDAKRSRQGLLLSPQQSADGDLIGVRLPRSIVGQPIQPGRALVHLGDGTLLTVAVPTPPSGSGSETGGGART